MENLNTKEIGEFIFLVMFLGPVITYILWSMGVYWKREQMIGHLEGKEKRRK